MNPQVPEELISAYFDGEVTPEERVVVERLLADSEDAQRSLNETARLSGLLHSFPRESAPVELVSKIRQLTDQVPLVPPARPVAATSDRWRELKAALISAMATAAGILIVWNIVDHSGPSRAVALNTQKTAELARAPGPAASEAAVLQDHAIAAADSESVLEDLAEQRSPSTERRKAAKQSVVPMPGDARKSAPSLGSIPAVAADAVKREAGTADLKKTDAAAISEDAPSFAGGSPAQAPAGFRAQPEVDNVTNLGLSNEEFLTGLHNGNVYTVASPDSNVAVVELTVVDIDKGAESIQVLLKKREIPQRFNDTDGANAKAKQQANADSFVVVYAIAPGDRLAKALEDIGNQPETFLQWNSQPPLQLPTNEFADRKLAAAIDPLAKSDSQTEALKPGAGEVPRQETEVEQAEAEQIVNAYVGRNLLVQNSAVANPVAGPPDADGIKEKGVAERQYPVGNSRSMQRGFGNRAGEYANAKDQLAGGYKLLHVPTNKSLEQQNVLLNNLNVAQNGGLEMFSRNGRRLAQEDKASRAEAGTRPVRMLFVLHANQPEPAAGAVPAPIRQK
ncbi:MAG: hypothetical protein JSS49_03150 [Planctomycetes bacterium]|nr:hypothetical protein [Planctomycetota bacterium]